jgi:hypothetical protein
MRCFAGLAGLLACALASPAIAADATATLEITGKISPRCAIDLHRVTINRTLTDGAGGQQFDFSVDCNQRLVVNMSSLNGGLKLESSRPNVAAPGFITFLPYIATFNVAAPGAKPVSFESERMIGGASGSIGVAPFEAKGSLDLRWTPEAPLIAGSYNDVIEIRVSGAGESGFPAV